MDTEDIEKLNFPWVGTYRLDENKNAIPCKTLEWAEQIEKMSKDGSKKLEYTKIYDYRISTIWLGLDHNFSMCDDGIPLLFETMVFKGDSWGEIYMDRYPTWDEAIKGHAKAIQWVKDGCKEDE